MLSMSYRAKTDSVRMFLRLFLFPSEVKPLTIFKGGRRFMIRKMVKIILHYAS